MNRLQLEGFEKPVTILLGVLAAIIVIGLVDNPEIVRSTAIAAVNLIQGATSELGNKLGEYLNFYENAKSIDVFSALLRGDIPGGNLPDVLTP